MSAIELVLTVEDLNHIRERERGIWGNLVEVKECHIAFSSSVCELTTQKTFDMHHVNTDTRLMPQNF